MNEPADKSQNKKLFWSEPFTLLLFLVVIINMGVGLIIPLMPIFMKEYNFTTSQMSSAFFLLLVGRFISSYTAGYFIQRIGDYQILWFALGIYTLTMFTFPMITSPNIFIFYRFLEGLCEGFGSVSLNNLAVILSSQEDRGKKMGYFNSAIGIGFILGPLTGSITFEIFREIGAFWMAGGLGFCGFLWLWKIHKTFEGKRKSELPKKSLLQMFDKSILKIMPLYGPSLLRRTLFVALGILLPLYLNEHFNLSGSSVPLYFTASAILTTSLMPLTGRVADTPHCKKTLISSLLIIGVSLALLGLVRNIFVFTLLFLLETIAFSFMVPAGMKIFGNNVANHPQRGNIMGSAAGLTELCAMMVPIVLLPLYRVDAFFPWFLLGGVSIIITFPFWQYREAVSNNK